MPRLRVIRAHYAGGELRPAGTEYDAEPRLAQELVHTGKAVAAAPRAPAPEPTVPVRRRPMTTKTAPGLFPGAPDNGD
jgi:hypothetical protein